MGAESADLTRALSIGYAEQKEQAYKRTSKMHMQICICMQMGVEFFCTSDLYFIIADGLL
jgi:hypothetical protein